MRGFEYSHCEECLELKQIIQQQGSVLSQGTSCWRFPGTLGDKSGGGLVIKDPWEFEERPIEGLLLKEATETGIQNVAQYYHYENVCTGGEMDNVRHNVRKGLSDNGGRNPFQ